MKKIWVQNVKTGAIGYLKEEITDELIEVFVPTERWGHQQRFWKNFKFISRKRAPRSDRGKLRLVASR